jgi:hypothetical protein
LNDHGEEDTDSALLDNGFGPAPAITGNDDMLDNKFYDEKTAASVGNAFSPQMETQTIFACRKPDSILALSFGSENEELQQELVTTQAKLRKMEAHMAAAIKRSLEATQATHHQMTNYLAAELINPLVTPPKKT